VLLYEHPFWRHIGYHEYPGTPDWPYRRAASGNYADLAGMTTLTGLALPLLLVFVAARKVGSPKSRSKGRVFVGFLSLFLNSFFIYPVYTNG
jgi:hypothetical protein